MGEGRKKQHTEHPPCGHNEWDNIRFKNMVVTLRCRVCRQQWKTLNATLKKCTAFYEKKCSKGAGCELVHINRYKHTRELCVNSITSIEIEESEIEGFELSKTAEKAFSVVLPPPQDSSSIWCCADTPLRHDLWDQYDADITSDDGSCSSFAPSWVVADE